MVLTQIKDIVQFRYGFALAILYFAKTCEISFPQVEHVKRLMG